MGNAKQVPESTGHPVQTWRGAVRYVSHGPQVRAAPDGIRSHWVSPQLAHALGQRPQESVHKNSAELNRVCTQSTALGGAQPRLRREKTAVCLQFVGGFKQA